jgi:hypothetical protein
MLKQFFFLLICLGLVGIVQAKGLDVSINSAVKDTGKTKSEEAAAERYQAPTRLKTYAKQSRKKRSAIAHKKNANQAHYGKRLRKIEAYLKAKDTPVIVWAGLGILALALLTGLGMILGIVSFLGAFITLSILSLLALVLPFIDDIGISEDFIPAAILFLFGISLGYIALTLLAAWAGSAALAATGVLVIVWTLLSLLFAFLFYIILSILWKALKAVFRILILVFTLGLVDIGK